MDEYGTDSDGVGAAPSVARLLLELRSRVDIDMKTVGRALQVRPKGVNTIAVKIHPGGVDVAVAPETANDVALGMSGAYVMDPDDPDCFVSLPADYIDENYDALLVASADAVQLRAAGKPAPVKRARTAAAPRASSAGGTRTASAAKAVKPAPRPEPPRCPKCRQYELLASGECPSGWC
ncbi:hypothetical protein Ait01nite_099530 [Actinoplanes italicus]|uniref:Uncharacterized protein n=1 Tax=Actinoplanes italicus TaxID=113567 RepID=A0A2T0KGC6_9ACTN|nr:hypothetical protein [Actinoplanes italicus]PRX22493.1 hypothetical protein CLV67_1049 [Actinoplanes italicus]GIE36908.1 hypothetical protein Ait01nite_099530 [Actinoplanes italicus]